MINKHELSDSEFLRYSRQLLLEDIGPEGQLKLKSASVLIVGLGGLGSPCGPLSGGSGRWAVITLADDDQLELTNLQRQILYRTTDISPTPVRTSPTSFSQNKPDWRLPPAKSQSTD